MINETNYLESRRTLIKTINKMKQGFDGGRSLSSLTIGEFLEMLDQHLRNTGSGNHTGPATPAPTGRLVFGLRGVQDLFHCSHKQAQYYKDHVIHEAVSQNGRKIVVDVDRALQLFNQRRTANGKQ